ncbi:hypothetical protein [Wolbachia endosymbiont (group A) of Aleiodes leptofemur]|uniref:hypothetical protein n=1 Tax=Wolbachia endosymbiont (group A) of Aleiodes leptofemur TaxID=3077919 RepID=UPI0033403790
MLLACYSHKHISYRIRTIIRKAIVATSRKSYIIPVLYSSYSSFYNNPNRP